MPKKKQAKKKGIATLPKYAQIINELIAHLEAGKPIDECIAENMPTEEIEEKFKIKWLRLSQELQKKFPKEIHYINFPICDDAELPNELIKYLIQLKQKIYSFYCKKLHRIAEEKKKNIL